MRNLAKISTHLVCLLILIGGLIVVPGFAEAGSLNFALSGSPESLDPHKTSGTLTFQTLKSVYDTLAEQEFNVRGVNFAEASKATDRTGRLQMRNKRAAAFWKAREALDPEKGDWLAIAPDNELLADLTAPKWKITPSGVQIESKEDIQERIGRSTDCGDAFVLSLFEDGWWIF